MVEVGTPLTVQDYKLRFESLSLRHTPHRMTDMSIRPSAPSETCTLPGKTLTFRGAGALAGPRQRLLGYTLLDFVRGKTLMRDLEHGDVRSKRPPKLVLWKFSLKSSVMDSDICIKDAANQNTDKYMLGGRCVVK